jgi:hypothetical protein
VWQCVACAFLAGFVSRHEKEKGRREGGREGAEREGGRGGEGGDFALESRRRRGPGVHGVRSRGATPVPQSCRTQK